VVGAVEAKDDMVSDTRLSRRVLLRRKYGGEVSGRGLGTRRRRMGAVFVRDEGSRTIMRG
jgi:hypothetical protein